MGQGLALREPAAWQETGLMAKSDALTEGM